MKKSQPLAQKEKVAVSFPIVAIGASSGGLEAITQLLKYLPADTGMAFIFIQHLSPDYKSLLVSLLTKCTKMKVQEIEEMEHMKPDNIYVIPYNKRIKVTDGHIKLLPRAKNGPPNLSIDMLFTSLAETHKEDAIGVVLSGNLSDGTVGLKAIKQAGGITFAQDDSAKYHSMPDSAISDGSVDFILSPKEIARELTRISKRGYERKEIIKTGNENKIGDDDPDFQAILQLLHQGTGVDFRHYKMGTIKRRILRMMFLHRLQTLSQYVKMLTAKSSEVNVLYNDLLINVTDFFRDADAFEYLKTTLFPKLLKNKQPDQKLRIWVTACSTGQEAYSIAMLLIEILGEEIAGKKVQIFASDLSEQAIKKARSGQYSKYDVRGVSQKRITRFFVKTDDSYQIAKTVRDLCAFAPHNILSDPPFSRLDFISCCNLLIYFDVAMHKKVLTTFHYALNDGGCLMLSRSEAINSNQYFLHINKDFKIYDRKKGIQTLPDLVARSGPRSSSVSAVPAYRKTTETNAVETEAAIQSLLFARYIPAYVVINHAKEILQFKGATASYLEHTTGKATLSLMNMARPEIAFELRDAVNKAIETNGETHKSGIEIKNEGVVRTVSIDVIPIQTDGGEPLLLVVFAQHNQADDYIYAPKSGKGSVVLNNTGIQRLKEELATVRAELISMGEEKEKANRILQQANEEMLSNNEEFQSMNEEMETSKEEIESANQELITTNQELQTRNEQLAEAYDLSEAIVTTLHEPMLILDKSLRIKSTNKAFYKKFAVVKQDVEGKLLYELGNHQWDIPRLRDLLGNIIQRDTYFYDYEITHVFPGIGKKTMLLNAMRIVQQVENEQLILLAFTDITEKALERKAEKKELEDIISERTRALEQSHSMLQERNLSLERMNKELETFTYISSHDLQEPLRKIKNFTACLLKEEKENLSGSGKDYLQRTQDTVIRMQMLIEDLLAYSQIKHIKYDFEKADLNKMAREVIAEFKDELKEKEAVVKIDGLCKVNVIRIHFRQLLYNLVSNSIKFSHPKTPLRIDIKCEELSAAMSKELPVLSGSKYCHISFEDNGIGFDPKYKDRIFEVFQRLHEYTEYKGSGIGLAICKLIVESHNGEITATGKPGKGARFDIYIPVGQKGKSAKVSV